MNINHNKFLKNFLSLSSSEIIIRGANFIVSIFIARLFSVNEFGIINLLNAVLTYFILFVNFGYDTYGTRETAKDISGSEYLLSSILSQKLISIILVFGLYIAFTFVFIPEDYQLLSLFFILLLFTNVLNINWFYRGLEKMDTIFIARSMESIIYLLSIIIISFIFKSLYVIPVFIFLSQLASGFYYFKFLPPDFKIKLQLNLIDFLNLFKKNASLGLNSFFALIYLNLDLIMISYLKSEYETGIYGAAGKLFIMGTLPLHLILAAFFPELSRVKFTEPRKLKSLLKAYSAYLIIGALLFSIIFFSLSESLISFVYGFDYLEASRPLMILSATILFVGLSISFGGPLIAWGQQNNHLLAIASGAVVNLILNFFLIPRYSYIGAAYATLIAEIVVFIILFIIFKKFIKKQ